MDTYFFSKDIVWQIAANSICTSWCSIEPSPRIDASEYSACSFKFLCIRYLGLHREVYTREVNFVFHCCDLATVAIEPTFLARKVSRSNTLSSAQAAVQKEVFAYFSSERMNQYDKRLSVYLQAASFGIYVPA